MTPTHALSNSDPRHIMTAKSLLVLVSYGGAVLKIAVIGTGYVGLVTSTCLAESGNEVVGIDKDAGKINTLKSGKVPIYEPGLLELVQRNVREQRLSFTTDLPVAVKDA